MHFADKPVAQQSTMPAQAPKPGPAQPPPYLELSQLCTSHGSTFTRQAPRLQQLLPPLHLDLVSCAPRQESTKRHAAALKTTRRTPARLLHCPHSNMNSNWPAPLALPCHVHTTPFPSPLAGTSQNLGMLPSFHTLPLHTHLSARGQVHLGS